MSTADRAGAREILAPVPRRLQRPVKTHLCPRMILLALFFCAGFGEIRL
jgi:hypothetical protein